MRLELEVWKRTNYTRAKMEKYFQVDMDTGSRSETHDTNVSHRTNTFTNNFVDFYTEEQCSDDKELFSPDLWL